MNAPGDLPLLNWSFSVPNLVVLGTVIAVLWYKLHLLRLELLASVEGLVEKLRVQVPPYPVAERILEENFAEIRDANREFRARLEHVEALVGADGHGDAGGGAVD